MLFRHVKNVSEKHVAVYFSVLCWRPKQRMKEQALEFQWTPWFSSSKQPEEKDGSPTKNQQWVFTGNFSTAIVESRRQLWNESGMCQKDSCQSKILNPMECCFQDPGWNKSNHKKF